MTPYYRVKENGVILADDGHKSYWSWEPLYPKHGYWAYKNLTPFQRKVLEYIKSEKK